MSLKLSALYALSDGEVRANYDAAAVHTVVGTAFWMDELERRSRERVTKASGRLAVASFVSSAVSVLIAVGALVVSLVR